MKILHGYKALLGEGITWNHPEEMLSWVDIEGKRVIVQDTGGTTIRIIPLEQKPGSIAPLDDHTMLLALEDGVYHFYPETGSMTAILDNKLSQKTRFNDGKCDPAGRFWVGTMDLEFKNPIGRLYRIDPGMSVHQMISSVITSNGITWSPDKKWMYYIDTGTKKVAAYHYNNESGDIDFHSYSIEVPETLGYPDGCTIDAEGMLWIALWGGHSITRWNPHSGLMLEKIEVPAFHVTSLTFGGPSLNTLFITTASIDTPVPSLYPDAGSVFFFKPGVQGIPAPCFKP